MDTTEWQINFREANRPLLEALALRVPAAPVAFLRQLCKKQRILLDHSPAETDHSARIGATITVKGSQRWAECLDKSRIHPGQILYEDDLCMVINKPAGLAIHRAQGHDDNLLHRLQDFLHLRGETFLVAPIHRLDIGTSGAVLFGKGRAAISCLGRAIMAGLVNKHYLALVTGEVTLSGELDSTVPAKGRVKEALTRFRPVATVGNYTLLELELLTGRQHQIRRQLAESGSPIVGDERYHGTALHDLNRPFLHCHRLAFPQPDGDRRVDVSCPLSEDLKNRLTSLGFVREESHWQKR